VTTAATALLIYDGDCGFCTSAARWSAQGWHGQERAVSFQELGAVGLEALGLSVAQAEQAAWWVDESGSLFRGHRAIGASLVASGGRRAMVGHAISTPPLSWVAAVGYRVVVRYRHRLPGATAACKIG
jgi:predicted DCC family thiol-disulfide oxidoreductase YuxK